MTMYVLLDTKTGKYNAGSGTIDEGDWIPDATAETQEYADRWTMKEILECFPFGLPEGWKAIPLQVEGF